MVKLMASLSVIEVLKKDEARYQELFGKKQWGWVKQGYTRILNGFSKGLSVTLGPYESEKIRTLGQQYRMVLMRKGEALPADNTAVPTSALFDLAERAIGNTCVDCTIVEFKGCPLYQTLDGIDMPVACTELGKCPFLI
jgi:hypothetical protein